MSSRLPWFGLLASNQKTQKYWGFVMLSYMTVDIYRD